MIEHIDLDLFVLYNHLKRLAVDINKLLTFFFILKSYFANLVLFGFILCKYIKRQPMTMSDLEPTLHQRRIIYQARRGLKELDFYLDPYVKNHYPTANEQEQLAFERLLAYEDPDLLLFFFVLASSDDIQINMLITKIKALRHTEPL